MLDANTIAAKTMSSRWRIVSLLVVATLQLILIWWSVTHFMDSWHLFLFVLITATLVASGYDIATKGRLTRLAFCFWLPPFVCAFARDIFRIWHHYPGWDPMSTIFFGAGNLLLVVFWILTDPFGSKKTNPVIIKKEFT